MKFLVFIGAFLLVFFSVVYFADFCLVRQSSVSSVEYAQYVQYDSVQYGGNYIDRQSRWDYVSGEPVRNVIRFCHNRIHKFFKHFHHHNYQD